MIKLNLLCLRNPKQPTGQVLELKCNVLQCKPLFFSLITSTVGCTRAAAGLNVAGDARCVRGFSVPALQSPKQLKHFHDSFSLWHLQVVPLGRFALMHCGLSCSLCPYLIIYSQTSADMHSGTRAAPLSTPGPTQRGPAALPMPRLWATGHDRLFCHSQQPLIYFNQLTFHLSERISYGVV